MNGPSQLCIVANIHNIIRVLLVAMSISEEELLPMTNKYSMHKMNTK